MTRRSRDDVLMDTAHVWADRSTCTRNSVGAVISLDSRIISTGYNGAPAGLPHCDHTCTCVKFNPATGRQIIRLVPGDHDSDHCPALGACKVAVHAEANAIAFAARHGLATAGGVVHVTLSPCYACAQLIVNAGLTRVVYARSYRDVTGIELLGQAGVKVEQIR